MADDSSWIQNVAYEYQSYIGGAPVVSSSGSSTVAPRASDANISGGGFMGILNGISGVIDGVRSGVVGYQTGQYNPPLNPNTPYYNQYGVPMNPGAPGTASGPGSGFQTGAILPGVSNGSLMLIGVGLAAAFFLLRK